MRWNLVSVSLLVLSGCWQDAKNIAGGDPNATTFDVTVTLTNLDIVFADDIHILDPNEDFSPGNRLAPGDSRTTVIRIRRNEEVLFRAGRNGTVLTSKKCKCTTACPAAGTLGPVGAPQVDWNGSALSCPAW